MQTFITTLRSEAPSPMEVAIRTAQVLDPKRLGKQRVEAKQIWQTLTGTGGGFPNHPATKMWRGYEPALAAYGYAMCYEWRLRGYEDSLLEWFYERTSGPFDANTTVELAWPWWYGKAEMVSSHRSKLAHKLPAYYEKFFDADQPWQHDDEGSLYKLPYIWPDTAGPEGNWTISVAESKRNDWEVPDRLTVLSTRNVVVV